MTVLVFAALGLLVFAAGFVLGIAYGVREEQANEAERLERRRRYG